MASNFCENCGSPVSGNVCDYCGKAVRTTKNDRHMVERHTSMNEKLYQNNHSQFGSVREWVPVRNFTPWLLVILLIPTFGQIFYALEVMKDFKNYLWPRLQADSTLDLDSKEFKVRSPAFYVMILAVPTVIGSLYAFLLNLSTSYIVGLAEDDANSPSGIGTDVLIILFILFVILPVVIAFIVLLTPPLYIYHKHTILSQFINLRYGSNTHHSEYPVVNPSIFKVRQKPLIFFGISCASIISSLITLEIFITTFSYLATSIALIIAVIIWVTSVIIWFIYEKMWHDTMYDLIRFESSMKKNHTDLPQS